MARDKLGWVKLHRKITEKGFYKKSAYVHLWIHLLLKANHKPKEFMWNNQIVMVKEGQLITGRKQLSAETGISETSIERILNLLENEHQIGQQKESKYRLITIVKWSEYQQSGHQSGHQSGQQADSKRTASGQQTDTNKNNKNIKNENNDNNTDGNGGEFGDLQNFLMEYWGRDGRVGYGVITDLIELGRKHGKAKLYEAIKISATAGKEKSNARYVKGILEKNGSAKSPPKQTAIPYDDCQWCGTKVKRTQMTSHYYICPKNPNLRQAL